MTFLTTGICGLYLAYFRSFHIILQDKTVADFSRIRTRILRVAGSSADHHHGSGNVYSYNSNRSEHFKLCLKLVPGQAKSFWVQGGGGLAQKIRLRLPVCSLRFESQAYHQRLYSHILYYNTCHCIEKGTKINKNRTGFGPYFKIFFGPS